jgi:hypothetical protein
MREGKTPEEDILRLIDDFTADLRSARSKPELERMLADELGRAPGGLTDAVWSALPTEKLFTDHGIRSVGFKHAWGTESRWGIQGMPGLWSYDVVEAIREEEEW